MDKKNRKQQTIHIPVNFYCSVLLHHFTKEINFSGSTDNGKELDVTMCGYAHTFFPVNSP
jgi:hypothetical protein